MNEEMLNELIRMFEESDDKEEAAKMIRGIIDFMAMAESTQAAKQAIADRISTPSYYYDIQSGPLPKIVQETTNMTWMTVLSAETRDLKKHWGPIGVEIYPDKETAIAGHNTWRRMIMDAPPAILKDAITKEIVVIGS